MKNRSTFIVVAMLSLSLSLSLLLVPVAEAQEGFLDIYEVSIKPGHEEAYEELIQKYIEACDKVKNPITWSTYSVVAGKAGGTYRFVFTFEKWAERDTWPEENVMEKAYGEEEAQRMWSKAAQGVASERNRVWQLLPDGSSNMTPEAPAAKFYDVQIREVEPENVSIYRSLQRKWKAAYEASASKPVVVRGALVLGSSPKATFYRSAPFNTWAERDDWNAGQLISDHFGEEESAFIFEMGAKTYVNTEHFVSQFRPELSRPESQSPTTEP